MPQPKLTLDSFLKEEETQSNAFLATIKADKDNKDNVKITPWKKDGCNCSTSLSVEKNVIDSVEKTEHTQYCCGHERTVVKVNFKKNASIDLADVFKQLASKRHDPPPPPHSHHDDLQPQDLPDSFFPPEEPSHAGRGCRFAERRIVRCNHGQGIRIIEIYRDNNGRMCRRTISECFTLPNH